MARRALIPVARGLRRLAALATLASLAAAASSAGAPQDLFEQAQALQRADRPAAALELAEACSDPLLRAQARLFVLHHGGDPAGALSAGLEGLGIAPEDPWLVERSATLALDLGAAELGAELARRFALLLENHPERGAWRAQLVQVSARAEEQLERGREAQRALTRAQLTAALATLASLLAGALALRPR